MFFWVVERFDGRGRPDAGYGNRGTLVLGATGARTAAVDAAADGSIVAVLPGPGENGTIAVFDPRGKPAPGFNGGLPRTLPGTVTAVGFDQRGRVLAAQRIGSEPQQRVRRLLPDGRDDPSWKLATLPPEVAGFVTGADAAGPLLARVNYFFRPDHRLLGSDGGASPAPAIVRNRVQRSVAAVVDRRNRIVMTDGVRLWRTTANLSRVRLLRSRLLPPRNRFLADGLAIDRQGRILVGGRRLIGDGEDPFSCVGICREDYATSRGVVLRLEGGDQRVAIPTRRLGPSVAVQCLATAAQRCRGSLRIGAARRAIDLRAGTTRRFAVPARVRRGARSLRVSVRVHDATGGLATAARTLRAR